MIEEKYYIRISPEVLQDDIFRVCYPSGRTYNSGCTYVYSAMTSVLSGGENCSSLLTGLTIPIMLTQSAVDCGYYSVFDGAILQSDVVKNFIFSATTAQPRRYYFYNTSESEYKNYLELSSYTVDWGDGTPLMTITTYSPNYIYHDYVVDGTYEITLRQSNPWGINTVTKTVHVPFTATTISNPNGIALFTPKGGSWSCTPISYDYIFTGDSNNNAVSQSSFNYVTTPFTVSGYTNSRITELKLYGSVQYQLNTIVYDVNNLPYGVITAMTSDYTGYTVNSVSYIDFKDGTTIYFVNSNGLIFDWLEQNPITKDESLLNIVMQPEVQSDIFIERGKNSALERIERLGEVDNIGSLTNYGYGFFNFSIQQNIR
jgi:hypothetical protein